jgi:hypothetical protein
MTSCENTYRNSITRIRQVGQPLIEREVTPICGIRYSLSEIGWQHNLGGGQGERFQVSWLVTRDPEALDHKPGGSIENKGHTETDLSVQMVREAHSVNV